MDLEKQLLELALLVKQVQQFREPTGRKATELVPMLIEYRAALSRIDGLVIEIDQKIMDFVLAAKTWGELASVSDEVMDVCIRVSAADYLSSRGPALRRPASPLHSFGSLVLDAATTAAKLATAPTQERKALKHRLMLLHLALDDLVFEAFQESR